MVMQIKHLLLLLIICSIAVLILVERSSSTISYANTEADLKFLFLDFVSNFSVILVQGNKRKFNEKKKKILRSYFLSDLQKKT